MNKDDLVNYFIFLYILQGIFLKEFWKIQFYNNWFFSMIEAPHKPIDLVDLMVLGRKLQFIFFLQKIF